MSLVTVTDIRVPMPLTGGVMGVQGSGQGSVAVSTWYSRPSSPSKESSQFMGWRMPAIWTVERPAVGSNRSVGSRCGHRFDPEESAEISVGAGRFDHPVDLVDRLDPCPRRLEETDARGDRLPAGTEARAQIGG